MCNNTITFLIVITTFHLSCIFRDLILKISELMVFFYSKKSNPLTPHPKESTPDTHHGAALIYGYLVIATHAH
ncbi:MAG: hypothetical protein ACJAUV_001724 [Flavobacteriales bacterium]|jgi:hypothetical protein